MTKNHQLLRKINKTKVILSQLSKAVFFLDMKCENRDINVLERANIPKFSKLDGIVTPLRLRELFFGYILVDMTVGYAKLYSHRKKSDISCETTNEKIRLFLRMLLFSGCHKLPDRTIYWEATPDTFVQAKSDSMCHYTFKCIFRNLHLCDNKQLDK